MDWAGARPMRLWDWGKNLPDVGDQQDQPKDETRVMSQFQRFANLP
jgi:hypothetical protein